MPTYAYACTQCEHHFEIVQSFTDDTLTVCPECEGRLRKLFNTVGIVFKGSGFYRTDSRGSGKGSSGSSGSSTSSGSSGSSGSTSGSSGESSSSGSVASTSSGSSGSSPSASTATPAAS